MTATTDERHEEHDDAIDWVGDITRYGWLSKGLVFVIIGVLAIRIASTAWPDQRPADQQGALRTLAEQPFGSTLLAATAAGLSVFMLWNVAQALIPGSTDLTFLGICKRVGWFGLGLFYGALALAGFRLAWSDDGADIADQGGSGVASETDATTLTARLLALPGGRWVAIAVALVILIVALYHCWKGVTFRFVDDLDTTDLDRRTERWIGRLGALGFVARGLVLGVVGGLLLEAAIGFDPDEAVGLDGALRQLADVMYGRLLLGVVGIGLIVAGLYDMITFRRQELR